MSRKDIGTGFKNRIFKKKFYCIKWFVTEFFQSSLPGSKLLELFFNEGILYYLHRCQDIFWLLSWSLVPGEALGFDLSKILRWQGMWKYTPTILSHEPLILMTFYKVTYFPQVSETRWVISNMKRYILNNYFTVYLLCSEPICKII